MRFPITDETVSALKETAAACNYEVTPECFKDGQFIVCGDCILYPPYHVGLMNVNYLIPKLSHDGDVCCLCGAEKSNGSWS